MQDGELLDIFCTSKRLAYTLHLRFVGFYVLKKERVGNGKLNFQRFLRLQITLSVSLLLFSTIFFRNDEVSILLAFREYCFESLFTSLPVHFYKIVYAL